MDEKWTLSINVKIADGSMNGITGRKVCSTRDEIVAELIRMLPSMPPPYEGGEETITIVLSNVT